MMLSDVCLSVA